jgi:hypothetical protein
VSANPGVLLSQVCDAAAVAAAAAVMFEHAQGACMACMHTCTAVGGLYQLGLRVALSASGGR